MFNKCNINGIEVGWSTVFGEPVTAYRPESFASKEINRLWQSLATIIQADKLEGAQLLKQGFMKRKEKNRNAFSN